MLVSHRDTRCADLDARVSTIALLHTRFRIHLVENDGVICDDSLALRAFDRKGELGRPVVTIVLEGRARLRSCGLERWLERGSIAQLPSKSDVVMRQEAEPRYVALVAEWDPGTLLDGRPSAFDVCVRPDVLGAAEAIAARLRSGDAGAAAELAALVAGSGLQTAPFDAEEDAEARRFERPSAALDRALSLLDAQPMTVDLEQTLGLSARQVSRVVSELNARYGFNAGTWRDARNRRRLLVATALLSRPGRAIEDVARAVGYGSAIALCHAFANASLPSPASIAELVREGALTK